MKPTRRPIRFSRLRDVVPLLLATLASGACAPSPAPGPAPTGEHEPGALSDACGAPSTPPWVVQGAGDATPMEGRKVAVEGVVVGDFEGPAPALRGFYVQDPAGDDDPATSDAVFVFNGDRNEVRVGDIVRVQGTAEEVEGQTQVTRTGGLTVCGTGAVVEPVAVALPFRDPAWPERVEGMLVRVEDTLYVTDHYRVARFGEVTLSSAGRLPQPTEVARPGPAALGVQQANERNGLVVDDARNEQNPEPIPFGRGGRPLTAVNTLRGGDTVTGLVGVMTWGWGGHAASGSAWRLRPIGALGGGAPDFRPTNPRPGPPDVGGSFRVGSFNLLNYFNTFEGCTGGRTGEPTGCRGAEGQDAFQRQWRKTVAAITAMDVDVLGVLEMENDGYGPESAISHLVDRLNEAANGESEAEGASDVTSSRRPWAFLDVDAATGTTDALGTDAIKVGLLYRDDRVRPVGRTAVLATDAFVNGGDAEPRNRPSLAQAFETPGGDRIVVDVNHLKSKGSPCDVPAAGDGQGNCNDVRTAAARELATWLAGDPTDTGTPHVLIVGDLNAYGQEDPVRALTGAGYTDLLAAHAGDEAYTYVFGGQWGRLDHALASPSLAEFVTGAAAWHVNADEPPVLDYATDFKSEMQQEALYDPDPYRSSDHDPVVVGVEMEEGGRADDGARRSPGTSSRSTTGHAWTPSTGGFDRGITALRDE